MVINLLVGLPGDRPGGLVLTILYAIGSGAGAVILGLVYAWIGVTWKRASLSLQAASAFIRGVPVLLLIFLTAHLSGLTTGGAGLVALSLYSFSHVGEVFRSFLGAYPAEVAEQARVMGMLPIWEWLLLRIPWTLRHAWAALSTHWISLLKDTGALVVLGVGELTTVAKALAETPTNYN
ncbi:MAG: hypothetical protein ACOC9E_07330, partial [Chloroflexota bacterium]